jgi:N-acyl-D-amino-acid deacylase
VPHAALRTYVMGDRGADHTERATADDIEAMSRLCEEGIRAGALGFTTSRTWVHRTSTGESIGTLTAATDEVLGIADALTRAGTGVIQLISDAYQSDDDELVARELELLGELAPKVGRPLSFTVQQNDDTPDRFRELLAAIAELERGRRRRQGPGGRAPHRRAARAARLGQPAPVLRPRTPLPTSTARRAPRRAAHPRGARAPPRRARRRRGHLRGFPLIIHSGWDRMYPLADPPDYEPTPEHSVAGLAAAQGASPSTSSTTC